MVVCGKRALIRTGAIGFSSLTNNSTYNLLKADFFKFTDIGPVVNHDHEDLALRIYSNILKSKVQVVC